MNKSSVIMSWMRHKSFNINDYTMTSYVKIVKTLDSPYVNETLDKIMNNVMIAISDQNNHIIRNIKNSRFYEINILNNIKLDILNNFKNKLT